MHFYFEQEIYIFDLAVFLECRVVHEILQKLWDVSAMVM